MRIWITLAFFGAMAVPAVAQPTYSQEVSRIMQEKCQICHRPNDIAPFTLMNYEEASTWAEDIRRVVTDKIMPPWKPVPGHGEFRGSYGLTDEERQTLISWVNAGAPEGDPSFLPEEKVPTGEWQLGDPDLIVEMSEPFTPARGKDVYRCFVVTNPFEEAVYVKAADVLPGNRRIVHHVILYMDDKGQAVKLDEKEEGPGYTCFGGPEFDLSINSAVSGWAPGTMPRPLPDGIAVEIPKGGQLVMQVHYYTGGGGSGEDTTKIGLYFAKEKVERRLFYLPMVNTTFRIPAGAANHEVNAAFDVPPLFDGKLINIFPHMHVLGRKIQVSHVPRGDDAKPLIFIDDWDFNWQGFYTFQEPLPFGAFDSLRMTCTFDNSENNPRNPSNPLKDVRWGEGTEDEMCLTFVGVTFDRENLLPFNVNGVKH
jgi:hypothetical protein